MTGQSLLGLAAAGVLAAGLTMTAVTAASAGSAHNTGAGVYLQVGAYPGAHRVCKPVVKKVKWHDRKGKPHWTRKVVSQRCWWEPAHNWNDLPYNSPVYRIGPGNRWLGGF